jgi:hypothetical protein
VDVDEDQPERSTSGYRGVGKIEVDPPQAKCDHETHGCDDPGFARGALRRSALIAGLAVAGLVLVVVIARIARAPADPAAPASGCGGVSLRDGSRLMKAYARAGGYPTVQTKIPMMGLHLLDRTFHYTVDNVDHHPTLLYGTFDGNVLFAEASVTLATLQDAIAAPGHVISFRFRQPRAVQGNVPWPTRFAIQYIPDSRTFRAGFEQFRTR